MAKRENKYQKSLIDKLKALFPGILILKNDPTYIQGIPDLLLLYKNKWAGLECKRAENENHQPNQDFYVDKMNSMSYAAFVYPENEEEVLSALEKSFKT